MAPPLFAQLNERIRTRYLALPSGTGATKYARSRGGTMPLTQSPPISRGYCGFARKCARRFRAQHASVFSRHTGHSSP